MAAGHASASEPPCPSTRPRSTLWLNPSPHSPPSRRSLPRNTRLTPSSPWSPSPSRPSSSLAPGSVTFCFIYDDYFACEEQINRSHNIARDRPQLCLRPRSSAASIRPPRPSPGFFELSPGTAKTNILGMT
ncbi:uncharacterized protein LOC119284669 [Triticum dicoccoides]|uniref:uncharacterized protein LOC119284669 n=1 Tax=Triticum dicoccoides TaxID=85692 RepID=UPI00189090C1|nr:uncharacterized protein LOC119284669 [Triticum dicoccoides]